MNFLLFSILFSTFLVSNAQNENAQNEHEPGSVYSPNYTYKLTLHGDPKNMYKLYEKSLVYYGDISKLWKNRLKIDISLCLSSH